MSKTTSLSPNFNDESASNNQVGIMARPEESANHLPGTKSILLAEDDEEMRRVIALHLRRDGFLVTECRDGMELLDHLNGYLERIGGAEEFDLIVSDIRMPGVFGLSVAAGAVDCQNFPPMILITAFGDVQTHRAAEQYGVKAVLDKPFRIPELLQKVREHISA
jgi:CheY-like chemotaxis protein